MLISCLTNLGLLFSLNQLLYLLIAMWIYPPVPEKLVMVLAMVFGAHLLPYSWLYQSKSYRISAVVIPIAALIVGIYFQPCFVAGMMVMFEIVFSLFLIREVKNLPDAIKESIPSS